MTTYSVSGVTWEPLDEYLAGWLPGVLGLPCPSNPPPDTMRAWNEGVTERLERGHIAQQINNILWHSAKHGQVRRITQAVHRA